MMSPSIPRLPAVVRRVLRLQRRSPGSAALIVLTLALALGANTAVLSVADALLLRAVPFRDAGRLVAVSSGFPSIRLTGMGLSGPEALELQELTRVFAAIGPYTFIGLTVQGATGTEQVSGVQISRGAMDALGVAPFTGRPFAEADYARGGAPVVLIGHALWTRVFGADRSIVGRVVRMGGISREVIGIVPEGITLLNRSVDVWTPLPVERGALDGRTDHRLNVVGRIADGRTIADVTADLQRAMSIWQEETGEMHAPNAKMHPLEVQPLARATTGINREPVAALVAAVAFVLLIACANISTLLVARADRRRADVAVQLALGATRRRLLADSLTEGLMLAAAGCAGGLAISQLIVGLLKATWPVLAHASLALDYRVLGLAALLTAAAGTIIGIAPILRLDVRRAGDWLKTGARGSIGGPGRMRLQKLLIALQIALAVLLSGSAALMVRSLLALTSIETGVDADSVLRAQISLPDGGYTADGQVWSFYDRLLERVRGLPGVTHASVMSGLPPLRRANNTTFLLDGQELVDHSSMHQVEFVQHISPGYLRTLRIPLREGRDLTPADDERAAPAALVNETLARQFWPNGSAIGHRLKPASTGPWFTVVGVVADVRQAGVQAPAGSEVYVPHRQSRLLLSSWVPRSMNLIVRSSAEDPTLAAALRAELQRIDPAAAISGVAPLQTVVDRTIAQPRLFAWMFGAFAALALVVAGVGVYAVTSYAVGTRLPEFGVRMALGARPRDVLRLVMNSGLPTIAAGVAAGSAAAAGAARLLRNLLYGIEPLDPASLALGAMAISVTAVAATLLPAARAARVDPLTALREP